MKVLVTGASGQVGQALLGAVPLQVDLRALTRAELDIRDESAVRAAVQAFKPEVIINAAAYTAVDKAEAEPELAGAVNADGPRYLAQAAAAIPGCRLLHLSTDYVFDGRASEPYKPGDATNPISVYGRSKLLGERAVLAVLGERAVVLRTAWVYAAQGRNFLLTMLRLMREHKAVRVVGDQEGTPTAAASIACALWAIAERRGVHGILHWTDAGKATWYDFAAAIVKEGHAAGLLSEPVELTRITTADYPTPAHRPANSVLDIRASITQLRFAPPPWQDNLRATLAKVARS
ncbi:MAG TPA: dTDP-4-dehydrorhamnose reductase [Steroidobacteraceae bacterium]